MNSSRLKHKLTVYCCCCCFCFVGLLFCFVLSCFVCLFHLKAGFSHRESHRMAEVGRVLIWSNCPAEAGPPSAGCPGPCPDDF